MTRSAVGNGTRLRVADGVSVAESGMTSTSPAALAAPSIVFKHALHYAKGAA